MTEAPMQPLFIEEKRLIRTLMSGKPSKHAQIVTLMTVLFTTLATLFYWLAPENISLLLPAVNEQVFQHGQIWRIFTAIFIHADLAHLLSNVLMLTVFSFFVFGYVGYSVFPVFSVFAAAIVNAIVVKTYPMDVELLGASGLVYILGGFWFAFYFLVQRQYLVLNRLIRVIGIAMMIFLPTTFTPTTSYRAHALGFVFGVGMAIIYFYKNRKLIRSHEVYKVDFIEQIGDSI